MRIRRIFASLAPAVLVAGLCAAAPSSAAVSVPAKSKVQSLPGCQGQPLGGVAGAGASGSRSGSPKKASAAQKSGAARKAGAAKKSGDSMVGPASRVKNSRPDYVSVNATRVLDTRAGFGAKRCRVKAYSSITVDVASTSRVPRNARAVAVNVTSLNARKEGKVTLFPAGTRRPGTAHLFVNPKSTDRSFTIVPISKSGHITLATTAETDLVLSVVGYFAGNSQYRATRPVGAFDTRTGLGAARGPLMPSVPQRITIPKAAAMDPKAEAVVVTVTARGLSKAGSLAVWTNGAGYPATTDVSISAGRAVTRTLVVSPSRSGRLQIQATTKAHVSVSVLGHFRAATDLWMIPAKNVVNTKTGLGWRRAIKPGAPAVIDLGSRGVPAYRASTALVRLTTLGGFSSGYAGVFQHGYQSPLRSVTIQRGRQHTNTILVPVGSGKVTIRSTAPTHAKMDLVGYFAKPPVDAGQVSLSSENQCVATPNGTVKCWGSNDYGQLGNESRESEASPITVPGITDATQVASGYHSTCVLRRNKTVSCWGLNAKGQLGNGTTIDSFEPVQVAGIRNAVEISGGPNHYCARLTTGKVKCWGYNYYGQLGNGTDRNQSTPVFAKLPRKATSLNVGFRHNCAVLDNKKLACWGYNSHGQSSTSSSDYILTPRIHPQIQGVTSVAAGGSFTCATVTSGRVKCWGGNGSGQLGDGSNSRHTRPSNVLRLRNVKRVVAGYEHACAIKRNGLLSCWGEGGNGQLGNGSYGDAYYAQAVSNLDVVHDVSAGVNHTCAIRKDRTVYCWGYPGRNLLFPDSEWRSQPVKVTGF